MNWRQGFSLRFFVGKKQFFAGILCVFQGFTNEFLAKKIRQNPQTHVVLPKIFSFITLQMEKTWYNSNGMPYCSVPGYRRATRYSPARHLALG